jgi:hypothetical protein
MITYAPQPLDTSSVELPTALHDLPERLAENTHDVWAATRIAQGWSFGPSRDDAPVVLDVGRSETSRCRRPARSARKKNKQASSPRSAGIP